MRPSYWSCSKFADWVRNTPKPSSATAEEWDNWRDDIKSKHPIRYWIAEEGLDMVQKFVTSPATALKNIRYYCNNRWVSKTHALTAHPAHIKPGEWCDVGDRFLPCMFNELVDFVEIETPAVNNIMNGTIKRNIFTGWRCSRNPESGIAHLEWAAGLKTDYVDKDHPDYGKPTHQAIAAQEILELYLWWKNVYPKRIDPYTVVEDWEDWKNKSKEEIRHGLDAIAQLEKQYADEDTEMMKRLIDVRESLWT